MNLRLNHVSFLPSLFLQSWFPACLSSCRLPCAGFSSRSAFTKVGFCCGWPPLHRGRVEVVSARLNLSHGTIYVGGVCNFLISVSSRQKFEAMDGPIIQPCVNFLREASVTSPRNFFRQNSVIVPCYSSVLFRKQREIHPRGVRADRPKRGEEKRSPWRNFASSFYTRLSPLSLPFVNSASREGCLFYLRFSLQFLDLPLFFFRDFPSFVF